MHIDERCGPTNWTLLFQEPNLAIVPIMNDVTDVAYRTNIFAYTYLLISIMWIATSCMIIGKSSYHLFILSICIIIHYTMEYSIVIIIFIIK